MSKAKTPVVIIGLDGVNIELIEKWAGAGKLPNLAKLMDQGAYGRLESVPNMNSAPAWTSMMTGTNPGKHGIYYFYDKPPGSYDIRYLQGGDRRQPTLWSLLSADGKKVGVINVPMTYPAEKVNGIMIAGVDAPGVTSPGFAHPPEVAAELKEKIEGYMIQPGMPGYMAAGKIDRAIEKGFKAVDTRLAATLYYMEKIDWDVFMVVFCETDAAQHLFWKYMDDDFAAEHPEEAEKYRDVILRFYQKCDQAVGDIVATIPPETAVIIHSDHGSGPAENGPAFFKSFLHHVGLLQFSGASTDKASGLGAIKQKLFGAAFHMVQKHTSREVKETLLRLAPGLRDKVDSKRFFAGIDWSRTKVFGESSRIELWINLQGREAEGIVAPSEYEELVAYLKSQLHRWRDPATGKKVVDKVLAKEEIYHGNHLSGAPDILVLFNHDLVVSGVALQDEKDGTIVTYDNVGPIVINNEVSGVHMDNGFFLISGPMTKSGCTLDNLKITDIAPTVLALCGTPIPGAMDGRVLQEAIEDGLAHKIDDQQGPGGSSPSGDGEQEAYSAEDKKIIEERLKGLGYL